MKGERGRESNKKGERGRKLVRPWRLQWEEGDTNRGNIIIEANTFST